MIRRFLDCSSGHLSPATWDWLDAALADAVLRDPGAAVAAAQVAGGRTRYGWLVYAPEEGGKGELPNDLARVLAHARAQGAEYVLLDCDAPLDPCLPVLHPDFLPATPDALAPATSGVQSGQRRALDQT